MKRKLLIIGASGHGRVVADIAIKMKCWEEIAFLDDNEEIKCCMGLKVIGNLLKIETYIEEWDLFVAIGNNLRREQLCNRLTEQGATLPILIHPQSVIANEVELMPGTLIMAGAIINSNTRIGMGCIINTGATVDHDNIIEDFVHISPGVHLAGFVWIGRGSWIGIGSVVVNNIHITNGCIIGASATVIKDILESGTYVGVPARRI